MSSFSTVAFSHFPPFPKPLARVALASLSVERIMELTILKVPVGKVCEITEPVPSVV